MLPPSTMKRIAALITLFAAGCAATLALGATRASSYTLQDLNGLGYTLNVVADLSQTPVCSNYYATGNGAPSTLVASIGRGCPGVLQAQIDALVAAYPPPAPPPTTTAATTTASPVTTSAPATTTTTVQPPTVTVTVPADNQPQVDALQAQVDALTAQIATLTLRVDRIAVAGDAAWLAFQQAVAGGADTATAADLARGTWLNAVNGLGAFAPGL